jgi:Holliday junction DNA helicase RuvA
MAVVLYTHFVVREDAQLLYGFLTRLERDVFRDLLRISGVGPKLAQKLISAISLEQLAHCARTNDVAMLTRVPGVGKKTAERLLVELKDRLANLNLSESVAITPAPAIVGEAEAALEALGYRPAEAQRAIALARESAGDSQTDAEALIRLALKQISATTEVAR